MFLLELLQEFLLELILEISSRAFQAVPLNVTPLVSYGAISDFFFNELLPELIQVFLPLATPEDSSVTTSSVSPRATPEVSPGVPQPACVVKVFKGFFFLKLLQRFLLELLQQFSLSYPRRFSSSYSRFFLWCYSRGFVLLEIPQNFLLELLQKFYLVPL